MPDILELQVTGQPLPVGFTGGPQALYEAMLDRMRVLFPTGQTSFTISDTEPTTNVGPWLKNGTQWYVWNEEDKRYIPADISPSWPFVISATAPADNNDGKTPLWLQIKGSRAVGWNLWVSSGWVPIGISRGTTAQRPTDPVDYERYWDTDIRTEIYYFDGQWRTVSGSPGDVKYVKHTTLAEAVQYNPGWQEIGQNLADDDARGRALVPAHKDPGGTPVANFVPHSGSTSRAAGDKFGEETHVLTIAELAKHKHASWSNPVVFAGGAGVTGAAGSNNTITSKDTAETGSDTPHNNLGPRIALWCLVKL